MLKGNRFLLLQSLLWPTLLAHPPSSVLAVDDHVKTPLFVFARAGGKRLKGETTTLQRRIEAELAPSGAVMAPFQGRASSDNVVAVVSLPLCLIQRLQAKICTVCLHRS